MLTTQRVLHGTTDLSPKVNDYRSGTATFAYTAGQYLYVGSEKPFNHLWFQISTANDVASVASVSLWWAQAWHAAVDVIDETIDSGGTKSLGQSGRVTWTCDFDKGWDRETKSTNVTGLSGTSIYELYWARFAWTVTLKATTAIDYIGQKFASDTDLFGYYPELNNTALMARFRSAKTDWNEQHFMAAEAIARDIVSRKLATSRSQIFDCSQLLEAGCHKAAAMIYAGCGPALAQNYAAAIKAYDAAISNDRFRIAQGPRLNDCDKAMSTTWGTR